MQDQTWKRKLAEGLMTKLTKASAIREQRALLGRHLQLIASADGAAYSFEPPRSDLSPAELAKILDGHYAGLRQLHAVLSPGTRRIRFDTPSSRAIGARMILELWHSVVVDGKGTDHQIARAVDIAEGLLIRRPVAVGCFINECAAVMTPAAALGLSSRALAHVQSDLDRLALAGALREAHRRARDALVSHSPQQDPTDRTNPGLKSAGAALQAQKLDLTILTRSQQCAADEICELGELFFTSQTASDDGLALRTQPIIIGPTGVGKTRLLTHCGARLAAKVLRISRASYCIEFARNGLPTAYRILSALAETAGRLILVCDEVDKFYADTRSDWSTSTLNELFEILDGRLPLAQWRATEVPGARPGCAADVNDEEMLARIRRMWVVGCGTWQHVFEAPTPIGFARSEVPSVTYDAIAAASSIPSELLRRFGTPIFISGPTRDELRQLCDAYGLTELARSVGERLDVSTLQLRAGVRDLQLLKTRLLVKRRRQATSLAHDRCVT